MRADLQSQPLLNVRSFRYSQDRLSESLVRVENYLSLIGLVVLVLGGIPTSVTRVFIQQKMKTIAILKCLGGDNRRVPGYLAQVLALGLVGSLLGLARAPDDLARADVFRGAHPLRRRVRADVAGGASGSGDRILISLLFTLPLLEIRRIKPILVLRSEEAAGGGGVDWLRWARGRCSRAGSWRSRAGRRGRSGSAGSSSGGWRRRPSRSTSSPRSSSGRCGRCATSLFRPAAGREQLYRPGNQTRIILLAGLGAFFVLSVQLLQINLLDEFNLDLNSASADLYLIDVRKISARVAAAVERATGHGAAADPTRARGSSWGSTTARSTRQPADGREPGPARAGVHAHLPAEPGGEREGRGGQVLGPRAGGRAGDLD